MGGACSVNTVHKFGPIVPNKTFFKASLKMVFNYNLELYIVTILSNRPVQGFHVVPKKGYLGSSKEATNEPQLLELPK